ncbi:ankyrin repeat-containing domain protein [Mycena rebaudengoi]|nr:ankyrin repeat-containing domain protein [Mycena rebaudengoi]
MSGPGGVHTTHRKENAFFAAQRAGNVEIATLLLEAGADLNAEYDQNELRPLHEAGKTRKLTMVTLLLDYGADIGACCGDLEMADLLLARSAQIEYEGHYGGALGFAVHFRRLDVVKRLLTKGADATVVVPLYVLLDGGPPPPHSAEPLYLAMGLQAPTSEYERERLRKRLAAASTSRPKWQWTGVPLPDEKKQVMALLLGHGVNKDATLVRISEHLKALADEVETTEEEFFQIVQEMIKEAEDAIPEVLAR